MRVRWRAGLLACLMAGVLGVAAPSQAGVVSAVTDQRALVQEALDAMVAAGAPGVLARVDDPHGHWIATSGVADLRTGEAVPRNARFRVASLTKSVIATIVLQLAEEHRLSLDRPVGAWLPGIVAGADRITVRQLLNHTSGLADYVAHPEFKDAMVYGGRTYRPEQLIGYAEELGPVSEPGQRFAYSNAGYIVLGLLVERVTGDRLETEMSRRVLRPAGMSHSYLPLTEPAIRGPHATGYYLPTGVDPGAPGALRPITELNPSFAWAAYGLVSDARDINRFYHALFGGRLVGEGSLRQMREGVGTPQAPVFPYYGLGLEAAGLTCGVTWGGTGSIPGYQTMAFADRSGTRRMTLSMNVQRRDPAVAPLLMAGVDALNRYFCGTSYSVPR
ncbi:class A beta-lactamase-related serine hydrolase [Nonomuraea terrae]|uniref:Class A beta-lactamase-related serine hydrolase n=1 Tax=Nonomuraea terrae TaxID=2530383 RepID=A0A4R4Y1Q4_9ACTN|nr:serine hydrolase domain-containing protein [Nonomuraea terrae]TDD37344.1 class A beta-lactamase-related serine hydrolase [Nonomuraea terrae]